MSRKKRLLALLLVTVVVLIFLPFSALMWWWFGSGVTDYFRYERQEPRLEKQVEQAMEAKLPTVRSRQRGVAASTTRAPNWSAIYQVCEYESDDAGWVVAQYRQVCRFRAITAWKVDDEKQARVLAGVRHPSREAGLGCRELGDASLSDASSQLTYLYVSARRGDCSVGLPKESYSEAKVHKVSGSSGELPRSQPWLVAIQEEPLVDESVGCRPFSVLFCMEPSGGPIMGDLPGTED